jgi:aminoglycoside phosphotransferase (APT) family kinase protein
MSQVPDLDPLAILKSLGISAPRSVTTVTGGADTLIWRVEHGNATYALRVFRPEQATAAQREHQALEAARNGGLIVPTVHATTIWRDRPAVLLSWCPGEPLLNRLMREPWRVWSLGVAFGRSQAAVHRISPPSEWLNSADRWMGWAGSNEQLLQDRLRQTTYRPALLHLDFHPLNVLTDGVRITAILDWVNAQVGDPRADVARTYTILRVQPNPGGRQPLSHWVFRRLLALAWRRGYEAQAGPLGPLALHYAWAGAVMVRDLAPRVGPAPKEFRPEDMASIRRWTDTQKRRAHIVSRPS